MPLGFHVSKKGRAMNVALENDLTELNEFGFKNICAQIFVSGPQSYRETLSHEEKRTIRKYVKENNITLIVHSAYVSHPWNRARGSIHNIKQEMKIADEIGADGLVIHLGAGAYDDKNLYYVFEQLNVNYKGTVWFEINAARASAATYETPNKLKVLFERIARVNKKLNVGLCIDTAHLYACGVDLGFYDAAVEWLKDIPKVNTMLHLNDADTILGSGKDKHAGLCKGNIWKDFGPDGALKIEQSGLVAILNWAESNNINTILERNNIDIEDDLILIRNLGYFI